MYGTGSTDGFLFIRIFWHQHLSHIVYIFKGHGRVKIRVRFGVHRCHQFFPFLFGQPLVLLSHVIRIDFLIFFYGFFFHGFGTSFPCHFRIFQIDNLCFADYIIVFGRRGWFHFSSWSNCIWQRFPGLFFAVPRLTAGTPYFFGHTLFTIFP